MTDFKTIFKKYDVRGVYGTELYDEGAEAIGKAFGTYIQEKGEKRTVVGMDNRTSSPAIKQKVVAGLLSTGVDVVDLELVTTPIFYFATEDLNIPAGMMVTASHNPAEYNGLKIQFKDGTLYGEELLKIRDMAVSGSFKTGTGTLTHHSPAWRYFEMITGKIKLERKLKVVIDAGNGTAGLFAPALFEKLGCDVIPLYCDSDPSFPNHFPDPTREANMMDLVRTVKEQKADLGLGFDGDGDRLGVVDEKGNIIWGDMMMILFWREILPQYPGADVIIEVKCSDLLVREVEKLGGKPFFYKTGHSLIKAKMKEIGAVFTGEMSGHMFFADEYYGFDDAFYAAGRLLRIVSRSDKTLSQLLADVPKAFITPELRVSCPEQEKEKYVQKAKADLQTNANNIIDVDGVRACFDDGWGLVRASNTGPELIVRCEGRTQEACDRILSQVSAALSPLEIR